MENFMVTVVGPNSDKPLFQSGLLSPEDAAFIHVRQLEKLSCNPEIFGGYKVETSFVKLVVEASIKTDIIPSDF